MSHWVPRVTLNKHHRAILGYLWPCVYFSLITLYFLYLYCLFQACLLLVEAVMSSMYALLVTRKHDSLRHSFCQVVLIIFRLCKNVIKFAPFISQSILSVAFMCQIWILNIFPVMFVLHNHHFVDFQFCSSREEIGKPNI